MNHEQVHQIMPAQYYQGWLVSQQNYTQYLAEQSLIKQAKRRGKPTRARRSFNGQK